MNSMERHKESRLGELERFVSELAYELNHTDKALPQILQTCRTMRINLQNKSKQCDEYYQEILYLRHQLGVRQPLKEKAGKQESKRPKSTAQKYSQKTLEKLVADQTTMVRTLSNEVQNLKKQKADYEECIEYLHKEKSDFRQNISDLE